MSLDPAAPLRELADDPSEFVHDRSTVLFRRHGEEYSLHLRHIPHAGLCVVDNEEQQPLWRYIQVRILQLNRLSSQILAYYSNRARARGDFIRPPLSYDRSVLTFDDLVERIGEADPFCTRLVELKAPAGQGKTILLENLALQAAQRFTPSETPSPLLLVVDLLGRFVGTVDDAIAGTLLNTLKVPGLSHRDVLLSLRKRWIVLALDGFDELAARVGFRDAFLRLKELVEQLEGAGTVILSARDTFFDSRQSELARRSYLSPSNGGYCLVPLELDSWTRPQGLQVFRAAGSRDPEGDLDAVLESFGEADRAIAMQPLFLTAIAKLWASGERFKAFPAKATRGEKKEILIDTFLRREAEEKWVFGVSGQDRATPLLSLSGHKKLLAYIAGEMWVTNAFRMTQGELELATEVALSEEPASVRDDAKAKIFTHAALSPADGYFRFRHEQFFSYFLALRIRELGSEGKDGLLGRVLAERELAPEVLEWLGHFALKGAPLPFSIASVVARQDAGFRRANVAKLVTWGAFGGLRGSVLEDLLFSGTLRAVDLGSATLRRCFFVDCSFEGSSLENAILDNCELSECAVDGSSSFKKARLIDCRISGLEVNGRRLFEPEVTRIELQRLGVLVESSGPADPAKGITLPREIADVLDAISRKSVRSTDMTPGDFPAGQGTALKRVLKVGYDSGVLRSVERTTSGPRREFFRLAVDRSLLLPDKGLASEDGRVRAFFAHLRAR